MYRGDFVVVQRVMDKTVNRMYKDVM